MIIGIDPGLSGAIAWVSEDGHLIRVADMPTVEVNGKKKVSPQMLVSMLEEHDDLIRLAAIEEVGAMPGQGVTSMFNFGYSAGILAGVCAGLRIPMAFFRPAVWKRQAAVPADKGAARATAQHLWPGSRAFDRVKDDGRAEASLLARWVALKEKANA
jgi:crossover junction endodeoxyribonuclease RuvC